MQALISIVGLAGAVACLVALYLRHGLFGHGPISIGLQVAGLLVMLWARLTFGMRSFHAAANPTQGALVTHGPYRYIRNPIYAGVSLAIWAGAAASQSWINVALALGCTAGLLIRIACEEVLLRQAYPEYAAYAARTKRLIPFVL